MLVATHLRTAGPRDRPRPVRVDGKEEAGGVLLMARTIDPATDVAAYLQRHETKGLLRFITCGSVDDGKSTLIGRLLHDSKRLFDDQLAALAADSRRHGTQGDGARLRAAARRPGRRARAGHHHRRRLPLLRHRQAQVHRRRLPGPRAVHAQHGHRRLDRGPRRGAGRCAQGPAGADAPAHATSPRCSASGTWCSRSTRWTWSATTTRVFDAIAERIRAAGARARHRRRAVHPAVGAARATT